MNFSGKAKLKKGLSAWVAVLAIAATVTPVAVQAQGRRGDNNQSERRWDRGSNDRGQMQRPARPQTQRPQVQRPQMQPPQTQRPTVRPDNPRWNGGVDQRRPDARQWDNNRRDDNRRWDNNRRGDNNQRWNNDRRPSNGWNNSWRNDRRYNWQGYRNQYRDRYRMPTYYSPYRGRGYSRLTIGISLGSGYYGSRYWINDPYQYRLPPAPYGARWVRYYNDVVLVDMRSGYVMDVIRNFFW